MGRGTTISGLKRARWRCSVAKTVQTTDGELLFSPFDPSLRVGDTPVEWLLKPSAVWKNGHSIIWTDDGLKCVPSGGFLNGIPQYGGWPAFYEYLVSVMERIDGCQIAPDYRYDDPPAFRVIPHNPDHIQLIRDEIDLVRVKGRKLCASATLDGNAILVTAPDPD